MMVIEQFGFVQVVRYSSGVRFAYDMRTDPPSSLETSTARQYLTDFAENSSDEAAAARAAVHASAFT